MKAIFFTCLVLALGLSARAEEEEGEKHCDFKEWMQFHNEIKDQLCNAEKADDKMLDAIIQCKTILAAHQEQLDQFKEGAEQMYEKCGTPNEKDVEGFTKVDLTNDDHKKLLMGYCSANMKSCLHETFKEMKEKGEIKKHEKMNLTDEEKEQVKTCMKKAVAGE